MFVGQQGPHLIPEIGKNPGNFCLSFTDSLYVFVNVHERIREMTGGKSIAEALDDMTALMETVGKL